MSRKLQSISDLRQDTTNANRGTERGGWMIRRSLERNGTGRSVLIDKEGNIIAGNKTVEAATEAGLKIRVVETQGDELIVVQRTDLDLNDPKGRARELAFADNRVAEVNLNWDSSAIMEAQDAYADLSVYFKQSELDEFAAELAKQQESLPRVEDIEEGSVPNAADGDPFSPNATPPSDFNSPIRGVQPNPDARPVLHSNSGSMTQATRVFYLYIDEARYGKFQKACELLKKIGGHSTSSDALIDLAIASADGASEPEE